jgi:hypothetical protein
VIARGAASVVLAGVLLLGTTGCTLFAVQATNIVYQPSDGTAADVGDVKLLNMIALTADGTDVGETIRNSVNIAANSTTTVGDLGTSRIILRDVNVTLGGLFPVYAQYGSNEGVQLMVPVLDGSTLSQYAELLPAPRATN